MPTLYVSTPGVHVHRVQGHLVAETAAAELARIPLELLDLVVLQGPCELSSAVVRACLKRGVPIAYLDGHGAFLGRLEPPAPRVAALQRAQLRFADTPAACLETARRAVCGKLRSMRALLRHWAPERSEVALARIAHAEDGAASAPDLEVLRGYEGAGATAYFRAMAIVIGPTWAFAHRAHRPPPDPFNALLSYFYTLVHVRVWGAVAAAGLNPFLGFFHADREGHAALASDLIEEWRPLLADRLAVQLANEAVIRPADFDLDLDGGYRHGPDARRLVLAAWERRLERPVELPSLQTSLTLRVAFLQQALHFARHVQDPECEPYTPVEVHG